MPSPSEVHELKARSATLEEIAQVFGVERREGELLRTWCRRIEMAIYREELEYKFLRDIDVAVQFAVRRDQEQAQRIREQPGRGRMVS